MFGLLLYKDQTLLGSIKNCNQILHFGHASLGKSERIYPYKSIILCMPSDWNYLKLGWMGTLVEWGFDSWRSWDKICMTDQKSLIHLPSTVDEASLVLLWSMAVWQGFYTERETTPFGELEHWLGSRVISRSVDRVWVGVSPLYRTMGTPAGLGPVASVTMMLHLRIWTTEAPASQSVFYSVAEKDLHSQTGASWWRWLPLWGSRSDQECACQVVMLLIVHKRKACNLSTKKD